MKQMMAKMSESRLNAEMINKTRNGEASLETIQKLAEANPQMAAMIKNMMKK